MRKVLFIICMFISAYAFAEPTVDVNITYEGSMMKVKETVCGWTPDLEKGYAADENGCFYTTYRLEQPLYGYTFTPKLGSLKEPYRLAYYIAFYDSTIPEEKMLHTEVMSDGKPLRTLEGLYHDRVMQGVAVLKGGETIRLTSDKEPHYVFIYVLTVIIAFAGIFAIVRRKK